MLVSHASLYLCVAMIATQRAGASALTTCVLGSSCGVKAKKANRLDFYMVAPALV